jgi:FMN phosphatase YigB (HAD superfamily)
MIKAISLDFWGTIAVFNPEYSRARTRLLAANFGLPEDEANARYKRVKSACDQEAEESGHAMTPLNAVSRLVKGTTICPVQLLEQLEQRAREFPPIMHPEIPAVLRRVQKNGIVVGISSNTNFLGGRLVQSFFNIPWNFRVYSDELGVSKPSRHFFRTVRLRAERCASIDSASEILHIGDNSICDVAGAHGVGMMAELVKSPDDTVSILKQYARPSRYGSDSETLPSQLAQVGS